MDERALWIWLQTALGPRPGKARRVLERYGSLSAFYEAGPREWRLEPGLSKTDLERLSACSADEAKWILEQALSMGQTVLCYPDGGYPELLRQLCDAPLALFVKGVLPPMDLVPGVAIVGTRKSTENGRRLSRGFARDLAAAGAVVVSGGAMGIDQSAHRGALEAGGITVCVLGCGIGYPYLTGSAPLREEIAQTGALVSEYPPGTPALAAHFPVRNRIISGLSIGTLVVEAARHSGSLITARTAVEQNREVFAVPGALGSETAVGTNQLIKEGAKLVTSVEDILEECEARCRWVRGENTRSLRQVGPAAAPEGLSADAETLFEALTPQPLHLSVLQERSGLSSQKLMAAVTELELSDAIETDGDRRYFRPY